jgi:hypothetical protein
MWWRNLQDPKLHDLCFSRDTFRMIVSKTDEMTAHVPAGNIEGMCMKRYMHNQKEMGYLWDIVQCVQMRVKYILRYCVMVSIRLKWFGIGSCVRRLYTYVIISHRNLWMMANFLTASLSDCQFLDEVLLCDNYFIPYQQVLYAAWMHSLCVTASSFKT